MSMKLNWSFSICFLVLIALPHSALAGVEEDMASAQKSLDMQDLDEAANKYRVIAEQNYFPAQVALGELWRASQDYDVALGWFMMAAYQGDAAGEFDLGKMYVDGFGVETNSKKALYWIKQAADKNYLPAVDMILKAYQDGGLGLSKDTQQAKKWELKSRALHAAAEKEFREKMEKYVKDERALLEAAANDANKRRMEAKKAEEGAAVKKVDAADEAAAAGASSKVGPAQTK